MNFDTLEEANDHGLMGRRRLTPAQRAPSGGTDVESGRTPLGPPAVCIICGKDLSNPLDRFGPITSPRCRDCFDGYPPRPGDIGTDNVTTPTPEPAVVPPPPKRQAAGSTPAGRACAQCGAPAKPVGVLWLCEEHGRPGGLMTTGDLEAGSSRRRDDYRDSVAGSIPAAPPIGFRPNLWRRLSPSFQQGILNARRRRLTA